MPPASVSFDRAEGAPSAARRFTRRVLTGCEIDLREKAALLVSELVTNVVVHGAGRPHVTIDLDDGGVTVSVHDDDPTLPRQSDPGADATSGRGMLIVDRFASDWGVEPDDTGKRVWFVLQAKDV